MTPPRRPRRKLLKILGSILAAPLVLLTLHAALALHPRPLFSHHHRHRNFTVHMREEIPPEITEVLDRVEALLSTSELYDDRRHHPIYIFNSDRLIRFLLYRSVHFGANLPNGVTYVTEADVARDEARCVKLGPGDQRSRTLSETIAHEIAHALLRSHLGWRADRRLPAWLREGYCEYVAQGAVLDDATGLSMLRRGVSAPGLPQFRNRLMVEYLFNVRGRSLNELVGDPPPAAEVEAAVMAGLEADEAGFLARLRARPGKP
jgi:hypothetical protein